MKKYSLILALLFSFSISLNAQELKPLLQSGDRICFIGNSITQGGGFHADIFLYYATRFPKEKVSFFNCGVSGDAASEILTRLEPDVFVHKPTMAVLMVGMNDMIRGFSSDTGEGKSQREQRMTDTIELYKKTVTVIADSLKAHGCKLIFQLPSIYDQTVKNSTENMFGVNDALGKCADFLRSLAPKYNAVVVDYWTIMKNINEHEQRKDSSFSIVSEDRVHPGESGHLVMAYQFLKTIGAPKYVSKIIIDVKTKKVNEEINCNAKLESVEKNKIEFSLLENALPYPVDEESLSALVLVPFTEYFNQEILQVHNLDPGKYDLFIDGVNAGIYTSSDLGKGVNLSMNNLTPQYKQALAVMKYCKEYRKIYSDLRGIAVVEYKCLQEYKGADDIEGKKKFLNEKLEKIKGEWEYSFLKQNCENYYALKPKESQLIEELNKIREQVYKVNIPKAHSFLIMKKK